MTTVVGVSAPTPLRMALGATISLVFVLGGLVVQGGYVAFLLQPAFFLIVLGGCIPGAVMGLRPKAGSLDRVIRLDAMAKGAILMAVAANVIGLIHVMENLDKPEMIGPGISVAFTAVVYSVMFWTLAKGAQHQHLASMQEAHAASVYPSESLELPALAFAGITLLLLAVFIVLYAIRSSVSH